MLFAFIMTHNSKQQIKVFLNLFFPFSFLQDYLTMISGYVITSQLYSVKGPNKMFTPKTKVIDLSVMKILLR